MDGTITNIQRFSIDDGPGIRTTVFLKGCNLRCLWCHNPECIYFGKEIQLFTTKCIKCKKCMGICEENAISISMETIQIDREKCSKCFKCINNCPTGALSIVGQDISVIDLMIELEKDKIFYENSNGGVTFSGGEPLLQKDFLKKMLIECKKNGIHTAVDTAGSVKWSIFEEIIQYVDLFLYDIKLFNNEKHKQATSIDNILILKNLKNLIKVGNKEIWVRIPIIPNINDDYYEIERISKYLDEIGFRGKVQLLPYHRYGIEKYKNLGLIYKLVNTLSPDKEKMNELIKIFSNKSYDVE